MQRAGSIIPYAAVRLVIFPITPSERQEGPGACVTGLFSFQRVHSDFGPLTPSSGDPVLPHLYCRP